MTVISRVVPNRCVELANFLSLRQRETPCRIKYAGADDQPFGPCRDVARVECAIVVQRSARFHSIHVSHHAVLNKCLPSTNRKHYGCTIQRHLSVSSPRTLAHGLVDG